MEILQQIITLKEKINQVIVDEVGFRNDKEIEAYEFDGINLIYKYCLSKGYNYEGFPIKYHAFFDDENFIDFLSFDVKYLYILQLALLHEDIFQLLKTFESSPEFEEYTDEELKNNIKVSIQLLEKDNISLNFEE